MQNNKDEINSIFKSLPKYLQTQSVYNAMIKYAVTNDIHIHTSVMMFDLLLEDLLHYWKLSKNEFYTKRNSKGMMLRVYLCVYLYNKGYPITEIKQYIKMCYQSVIKNIKYFENNADDDRFINDYNIFLIIANKYF